MILEVPIHNFGECTSKFSFSKKSKGLKYQYFFVKIGTKLPITIKNKRRNTNLKFEFQTILFLPPKKRVLVFEEKPTKKFLVLVFETIETQMFF